MTSFSTPSIWGKNFHRPLYRYCIDAPLVVLSNADIPLDTRQSRLHPKTVLQYITSTPRPCYITPCFHQWLLHSSLRLVTHGMRLTLVPTYSYGLSTFYPVRRTSNTPLPFFLSVVLHSNFLVSCCTAKYYIKIGILLSKITCYSVANLHFTKFFWTFQLWW